MALATTRWDSAEHLKTEEDIRQNVSAVPVFDHHAFVEQRGQHLVDMAATESPHSTRLGNKVGSTASNSMKGAPKLFSEINK